MKRRVPISITAVILLGTIVLIIFRALSEPLPTYKGQSLEVWFQKLPSTFPDGYRSSVPILCPKGCFSRLEAVDGPYGSFYGTTNGTREPFDAIRSIGTNALPYLIVKFSRRESRFLSWLQQGALKMRLVQRPIFRDAGIERAQALTGLLSIGPLPPRTVTKLKKLATDRDPNVRVAAKFLLEITSGAKQLPNDW